MIFLDRITTIPTTIDLKIPTSVDVTKDNTKYFLVNGGSADTFSTLNVNGGYADSIQTLTMNCGWASSLNPYVYEVSIVGGGANTDVYNEYVNGGYADTIYKTMIDGGIADDKRDPRDKIVVVLKHITTDKVYMYRGRIKTQNSLYFLFPFEFTEVPPVGQYDILVSVDENMIYKGILQIGKIENKNKSYKIVNNGEQNEY